MKKFYIVPNTETHYGRINADSKEQALEKFADSIDPDISAYFDAVRKEPVKYPQIYHQPDGKFEKAVNILVSCCMDDRDSPYYDENVRKDLVRGYMPVSMELIAELQKPYDMIAVTLQQDQPEGMLRIQKHFYRILCDVTGFILMHCCVNRTFFSFVVPMVSSGYTKNIGKRQRNYCKKQESVCRKHR